MQSVIWKCRELKGPLRRRAKGMMTLEEQTFNIRHLQRPWEEEGS